MLNYVLPTYIVDNKVALFTSPQTGHHISQGGSYRLLVVCFFSTVLRAWTRAGQRTHICGMDEKGLGRDEEKTDYGLFLQFLNPPSAQQRNS